MSNDLDNLNKKLRAISGEVNDNSRLVSFLYELMRDEVPVGVIMRVLANSSTIPTEYTNGWLAEMAAFVAYELERPQDDV